MKNIRSVFNVAALLMVCWITVFPQTETPLSNNVAPIPNNGQPINDYANVIDEAVEQELNQKIKDFKLRTNPQVVLAVATVRTMEGRDKFEYSLAIARGWKIGTDDADNPGALLLVAVDDRQYFTQISRDLEDELPDGIAGQLQRQYLVPAFRQGNYTKGVSDTIDAYIRTIEARTSGSIVETPEATPQSPRGGIRTTGAFSTTGICCLVGIVVLLILIFSRGGGRRGGGGFGGGAMPWILGSILANSMGSRGSSWGGDGGSSWGGGGGGGSDWGGFGGGGDFGGGGAGGDW